jgi:hypothetical protein
MRPIPQTDGVVVPVSVPEPQDDPPRGLAAQAVNEFLAEQAEGNGTENHDSLFVKPDDSLFGPKVQNFGQAEMFEVEWFGRRHRRDV